MNQSSYIAAFLLAGFVLFLAANNRLSSYTAVLWGTPQAPANPAPASNNAPAQSPAPATSPAPAASPAASSSGSIGDFGNAVSSVTSSIGKVLDTLATVGTLFGL